MVKEQRVGCLAIKPSAQLLRFLGERVRLEDLVRHHDELEREEVLRFGVGELVRLVYFAPNLVKILVDHGLDLLKLDAVVVVTKHEEELLR